LTRRSKPRLNPRALAALQAFGRTDSGAWEPLADRRGAETLIVDERPHEVFNGAGDLVGLGFKVRLFRRGREVPIDGHRLIVNPPVNVPEGDSYREDPGRAALDAVWDSIKTAPNSRLWRKPHGTVTTIYAGTSDGFLTSTNATYSTARAGGTLAANDTGTTLQVGQVSGFAIYETFLHFDTSAIGTDTVTDAALALYLTTDLSSTDFLVEARAQSWTGGGLTTGDWVPGADLGSKTLYASVDTNGIGSTGAYKTFTQEAALRTAAMTGSVEMVLASSRTRTGSSPSSTEYVIFSSANETGTTQDPKLTLTHEPGPIISSVSPSIVTSGLTGVVVNGTTFGALAGDAKVELGSTDDHDTATLVEQTVTSWSDTQIILGAINSTGLSLGTVYVYVTDETDRVSPGFAITLAAPPVIGGVNPPNFEDGQTAIVVTGSNFGATQGTGKLELIDGLDYGSATKVVQTVTAWSNTSIEFTAVRDDLPFTVYAVVTADNGLRSAPFAVSFGDPPPATTQGWTQVVLYGSPAAGAITRLRNLEIHEQINSAGYATWTSPLEGDVALATLGRQVTIEREGEGEIWPGPGCRAKIASVETKEIGDTGTFEVDFVAVGEADELGGEPLWASLPVLDGTVQAAANALVANTQDSWTVVVTGSGYQPLTKVWGLTNVLPALKELAEIANAYWRPVPTPRTVEIKNYHSPSGLLLTNALHGSTDSQVGLIASVRRYTHERPVVNAVQPYGKTDTDAIFDLRYSTRTSPYEIKEFVRPPFVIDQDRGHLVGSGLTAGNTYKVESLNLEALGVTRALVVFAALPATSSALRLLTANGKEAVKVFDQNIGGWTIAAHLLTNPSAGWQKFSAEVTAAQDHAFRAISLDNVLQEPAQESTYGAIRHVAVANGTSTTPSVTVNSDPDDLVIDFLLLPSYTSGSIAPGSGQQLISPSSTVLVVGFSSKRLGASPTRTMSWTLGVSQAWILAAVSIKPYRNLYLEDADSIADHGRHYQALPLGTFRVVDAASYTEASNTLYDAAADYLTNSKDGEWHVEVDLAYLPGHPLNWLPGDTVDLDYVSPELTLQETGLIVTERIQRFDDEGVRWWTLDLSNKPVLRPRPFETLQRLQERLQAAQANQV
jgi:hypothetical protein